jgi:hypothetical protein
VQKIHHFFHAIAHETHDLNQLHQQLSNQQYLVPPGFGLVGTGLNPAGVGVKVADIPFV